ncbi:MAG: hypothetical protein CMH11_08430 [Maritimibacter sp.]|nr:hypothetical protein [Maritimibacter sp.]
MGTKAAYAVPYQETRPVDVRKVQAQSATTDAGTDAHERPEQEAKAAASRDILALRRAVAQGQRPAGPPPSFEVSLLEVEGDLKQKLARMEAERTAERDAAGVQGQPSIPENALASSGDVTEPRTPSGTETNGPEAAESD